MTFNKPSGMRYVDMAIWFDAHIYDEKRDDETLFKYLYLLIYMLACKSKYFISFEDYDKFSLFSASIIYMRAVEKRFRKSFIKNDETGELEFNGKISILNYIKSVIPWLKVLYMKDEYKSSEKVSEAINSYMKSSVRYSSEDRDNLRSDMMDTLSQFPEVIDKVINETPYKNDPILSRRLKMSCYLTILNGITLTEIDKLKLISRKTSDNFDYDEIKIKLLNRNREDSVILWKLDDYQKNYVQMLVNKINTLMVDELCSVKDSYDLSDNVLDDIIASTLSERKGEDDL